MDEQVQVAERYPREDGLLIERSPRWVWAQLNGEWVANSKRALLVREPSRTPLYYFPEEDVRTEFLAPARLSSDGRRQYWDVRVGERTAEAAAWTILDPEPALAALRGYVAFRWNRMDHWYEEEEEVFVHPRDPYKRVDILPSSRHVRVEIDGVTMAETRRPALLFETGLPTRYYIPQEDVRMDLLEPTEVHTQCPYKGTASYWSARIGDQSYRNIVWSYLDPIPEAVKIKRLLCFFNEKVDLIVDGEVQERPLTPWS
ncbi:MAG: DUF427 domain-containing protein [Chloroflexi bacterium]|nr:DUF427 domain-containing protein [Chloroflexota bacterium]MCI0581168.1 DUF427 domain-containing protein [Chloroflexota bacterium]MCI0643463.1 DUF427 domain-containing protein [Chloroflexota bacterium]MCI0727461.1 DUF427 domain-containing protein [Chloroflexota bacterium]